MAKVRWDFIMRKRWFYINVGEDTAELFRGFEIVYDDDMMIILREIGNRDHTIVYFIWSQEAYEELKEFFNENLPRV